MQLTPRPWRGPPGKWISSAGRFPDFDGKKEMLSCVPELQVLQLSENARHRPGLGTALAQSEHSLLNGFSEAWFLAVHTAQGPGRGAPPRWRSPAQPKRMGDAEPVAEEGISLHRNTRAHTHMCAHTVTVSEQTLGKL